MGDAKPVAELREELQRGAGRVQWSDLRAHAARGGLFLLSASVELMTAAVALAQDDADQVQGWIESGAMRRPSAGELRSWEGQGDKPFESAIVRPFVLAREVCSES